MASLFKKDRRKIRIINWCWYVVNGKKKGIRGGIFYPIHRHAKANNKYMKNYDKNKESPYIQYFDANRLYG